MVSAATDLPAFAVLATIGSRSQASSLVTVVTVLRFLLVGRDLLAEIPRASLAAVIVAAAFAIIDVEGLDGWIELEDDRATPLPGLLVYRFDAPLFFANSQYYCDRLRLRLEQNPGDEESVVLDFEGIGSLDTTAADALIELHLVLTSLGLTVAIARANRAVRQVMERSGLAARVGDALIFPTINAAVSNYRQTTERTTEPNDTAT